MSNYFELRNAAQDKIIIDENYSCSQMIAKGSVTLSTVYNSSLGVYSGQVTVTGRSNPIIAVAGGVPVGLRSRTQSGSSYTFTLFAKASSPPTLTYYVYDEAGNVPSGVSCFTLYRADSSILFDAGYPVMRVRGTVNYGIGETGTTTYESGRTYAVALCMNTTRAIVVGGPVVGGLQTYVQSCQMHMGYMADNVCHVTHESIYQQQVSSTGWTGVLGVTACMYAVLDVTGQ